MPITLLRPAMMLGLSIVLMNDVAADATTDTTKAGARTLQTRSLAATCANCHGTLGKSVKDPAVPGLAGLPSAYIIEQMNAFKTGTREATIMHQIAKGYSDEQIQQMADYFASQKP
jgi:sulfide dehydrogenase cytochrome subunit